MRVAGHWHFDDEELSLDSKERDWVKSAASSKSGKKRKTLRSRFVYATPIVVVSAHIVIYIE